MLCCMNHLVLHKTLPILLYRTLCFRFSSTQLVLVCDSKKSYKIDLKKVTLFPNIKKGESVMVRKHFSQKQKLSILRSAKQTTVKDAAKVKL